MADIEIMDGGSVVLLQPVSDAGREWIDEHVGEDNGFQPYYPTITCERRYVRDILDGMLEDGLEVG